MEEGPPVERYFTYKEACEILRIGYGSLRNYVSKQNLPRYRHSKRNTRLLPASVVRQLLASKLTLCQSRSAEATEACRQ
jgi:DNA recombination-dependent growth factor C